MEHRESSMDDISNALQSGNLTSLAATLQVCRGGGLHKNNAEEPFKAANNETPNQKQFDAHQKPHKSDQYPEEHPLARIRRKRKRTYGKKSLADMISTCRDEGKQVFHDVPNVPVSDWARIEELQREMGVDIVNTKVHVSDAKPLRRQSKVSVSSSGTFATGTRNGCLVVDSSKPSTAKSSGLRKPIIQPEGEISSEDWLQIRMRNRSKGYRQSEPELLTENQNLDRDTSSTGDSTTTDTMDGNLIPLLNDSDTSNGDTFVEGMPLADPQFTAKKMPNDVEVTKKTYNNMIQNEQNRNNSDNKHEKENVIEEVKIKDGDVTLVLYKVKEESFLKMEHEYKKSQSNEKMESSISISNNNQHDCADTYKIEDVYNSTITQHDASLLEDTKSEKEHTDSDKRRGSYSNPMSSDVCFESQLKTNNELMNNARGVIERIDELVPDGTFNYSQASTASVSFEQKSTDLSESNTDIHTSDNVLRKENIQSEKHGINEETSLETVSSECTKVSNDGDYHSTELKDSKTDVLKLDAVFHNENKQSENDFVNGETSYVTLSSEFTEASKVGDFQNSKMLNTSTNKTEIKDDRLTSGIAITNIERKKRPPELLVTSETNLGNMNEDRGTNDKHNKSDTHTKPNVVASDKSVSNNVISNMQERNGSEKTESMETMSLKSFPMRISNESTEKNQKSSMSASSMSGMSGMSPAAREILFNQALKQINDNAIQSQGSFLNVLSSCRSDMKTIYSDLMSDIHVENTLPVEGVSNVEETPEDTLVIEPAVITEKSNTESEADDYEEKTYLTRRGHKIDTDPNREIIAHIKKTAKSHVISKWSQGHKRHKRPAKEKNGSASSIENNSQVEQELRLLRQKLHIMKTSQTLMVFKDEAKGLNPTEYVLVENECDLNAKSKAGVEQSDMKTTQNCVNHKKERQSKEEDDEPGMKTVKQYAHINSAKVKNSLSSTTVNENSDKNSKEEYKTDKESKRGIIHRDKPRKTNKNHGERRQENGNTQNLDGKFQVQHKGHVISKSKTSKSSHHENKSEVANKDGAIASDSDNNGTVKSIQMGRQSVDSGIVLGNILEDKSNTAQPKTNRGCFSKTGHSSSDLVSKENPARLSDNSSISELKSKSRQVNLGIDVASKIVDSRKTFYQNGAVHSEEIRELRIMKLFREIQTARNVTVFPRSYDIIEDKTSGFLMIDYDKQHRFFTFSDGEALDRFLYKPVQYELCCKLNCVSSNVRRKEKAFKALKQKQVHSKVS